LMLRCAPLFERSLVASAAMLLVGVVGASWATLNWRVQTDAKGSLAYASMTHVSLMFCEIGLGLYQLAALHLVSHACLRGLQMLKAPNALRDFQAIRAAISGATPESFAPTHRLLPHRTFLWLYRAAMERVFLDTLQDRFIIQPILWLATRLDRFEQRWAGALSGWSKSHKETAQMTPTESPLASNKTP